MMNKVADPSLRWFPLYLILFSLLLSFGGLNSLNAQTSFHATYADESLSWDGENGSGGGLITFSADYGIDPDQLDGCTIDYAEDAVDSDAAGDGKVWTEQENGSSVYDPNNSDYLYEIRFKDFKDSSDNSLGDYLETVTSACSVEIIVVYANHYDEYSPSSSPITLKLTLEDSSGGTIAEDDALLLDSSSTTLHNCQKVSTSFDLDVITILPASPLRVGVRLGQSAQASIKVSIEEVILKLTCCQDTEDSDNDDVPNDCDNCPNTSNPQQEDYGADGDYGDDGIGDACDCNDNGVNDAVELADPDSGAEDCDGDGLLDECEISQGQCYDLYPEASDGYSEPGDGIPDCCQCFFTQDLNCVQESPGAVRLTWGTLANNYDGAVTLYRRIQSPGGMGSYEEIATLSGGTYTYLDDEIDTLCECGLDYKVSVECSDDSEPLTVESYCSISGLLPLDYQFEFAAHWVNGPGPLQIGAGDAPTEVIVDFSIDGTSANSDVCGAPTQAFTMAVAHDPRLQVSDGDIHPELIDLLGTLPNFIAFNVGAESSGNPPANGWTLGVIYSDVADPFANQTVDFTSDPSDPSDGPTKVFRVNYHTNCSLWEDGDFDSTSEEVTVEIYYQTLNLTTTGQPIENQVVVCGLGHTPILDNDIDTPLEILLEKPASDPKLFRRGDCFGNGNFDLKDPVLMLNHIFSNIPVDCEDACDINDDGVLNMVDPIHGLMWLMGMGPPPAGYMLPGADLPVCAEDMTGDNLSEDCVYLHCDSASACQGAAQD